MDKKMLHNIVMEHRPVKIAIEVEILSNSPIFAPKFPYGYI